MTDPVDTDALRDMGATLTKDGHPFGPRITAAADELDRLRGETLPRVWFEAEMARLKDALEQRDRLHAVIENAPHAQDCSYRGLILSDGLPLVTDPCTCWKADVL